MPLDVGHVRRRRQPGRPQGPLQPGRRDLRRRALPPRRRRRHRPARRDLRLQPRRLVRRLRHPPRALHRRAAGRPRRLAVRADAGPLPVQAKATYAKEVRRKDLKTGAGENPAYVVESSSNRKGIKIFAKPGSPVVAVNDGRIVRTGHSRRLGNFVTLQDVYGNTYTYGHLKSVVRTYPTPKPQRVDSDDVKRELRLPARDAAPENPASRTTKAEAKARRAAKRKRRRGAGEEGAPRRRRHGRRQGAPLRQPGPPERGGRRRRDAGLPALRGLRLLPEPRLRPRSRRHRHEAAQARRARHLGHGPRPRRPHLGAQRVAPALRDPPGRARRPADRPEADPRRLEAARVDGHLPRRRPQPVRRQGRADAVDRPDPADEQGVARAAGARQPEHPGLRVRALGHPQRADRPPRAGHARVPRRLGAQADRHLAALRPLLPDVLGQRVRAHDGHGGRHRRHQRRADRRATRAPARSPS